MLKTEHWNILAFGMFIAIFTIFCLHVLLTGIQIDNDKDAEAVLKESCLAAINEVPRDNDNVFEESEIRSKALKTFKEQFNSGFDLRGYKEDDMNFRVPFIMLVDRNGYYINYSKLADTGSGIHELKNITTGLNTWANTYGNKYYVRYYLGTHVDVTVVSTGETISGAYDKVYRSLGEPSQLSFMADEAQFDEERVNQICTQTEEQINYYIATHNQYLNKHNRKYDFVMPQANDIDRRLMNEPSVISFTQSKQSGTTEGYINSYALCGSILDKTKLYYEGEVNGQLFYHESNCPDLAHRPSNSQGRTMDECVKDGALPCPKCVLKAE